MSATINDYKQRLENSLDLLTGGCERMKELPEYSDLMTIQEWIDNVKTGCFIDYDGNGNLVMRAGDGDWLVGKPTIYPSDVTNLNLKFPEWVTHVIWYNK